jgi:hypothetical protein
VEDGGVSPAESVARARRLLSNGYKPRMLGVIVGVDESDQTVSTAGHIAPPGKQTPYYEESPAGIVLRNGNGKE